MPPAAAQPDPELADDAQRRTQILEATLQCFIQLGIERTSVQDVARMANVSRGTIYRYFDDRQTLIDAGIEQGAQRYYADAAAAMQKRSTLAEQLGAFAEVVAKTSTAHQTRSRLMDGDTALLRRIVSDSDATLTRTTKFLLPYVEEAQQRGEVGRNVNPLEASEWLARIILSLSTVQSAVTFDIAKPRAVSRFVARFAVDGLR